MTAQGRSELERLEVVTLTHPDGHLRPWTEEIEEALLLARIVSRPRMLARRCRCGGILFRRDDYRGYVDTGIALVTVALAFEPAVSGRAADIHSMSADDPGDHGATLEDANVADAAVFHESHSSA